MAKDGNVEAVLDTLDDALDKGAFTLGALLDAVGQRGHGPFLALPALVVITPLGGIPGVPTVAAAIIFLFAVQLAFGQQALWLPKRLRKIELDRHKVRQSSDKLRRPGKWIDRVLHRRLTVLAGPAATRAASICAALLCLAVPPLELLPFAAVLPMAAIAAFGLALLSNDGVVMALGFALTAAAVIAGLWLA